MLLCEYSAQRNNMPITLKGLLSDEQKHARDGPSSRAGISHVVSECSCQPITSNHHSRINLTCINHHASNIRRLRVGLTENCPMIANTHLRTILHFSNNEADMCSKMVHFGHFKETQSLTCMLMVYAHQNTVPVLIKVLFLLLFHHFNVSP